jgi:hypothetical protein
MTYEMLQRAAAEIAARCDGAVDEDGVGFNGTDSRFGKQFATMPLDAVDASLARAAWEMLRKYRGQLLNYGVDFDDIPEPEAVVASKDYAFVDVEDGSRAFRFPYNPAMIDRVKQRVPGARFNGALKCWLAPATAAALEAAESFGFTVTADAARAVAEAKDAPVPPAGRVSVDGDVLVVAFAYNPQIVTAVKLISGRKFDGYTKQWVVPLGARDEVLALATQFNLIVDPGVLEISAEQMADSLRPTVAVERGWFAIRFPFDRDLVARVKEIGGATWVGDCWQVPFMAAAMVADWAESTGARVDESASALFADVEAERAIIAASKALDADITVPGLKRDLLPFQRAGVAYVLDRLGVTL